MPSCLDQKSSDITFQKEVLPKISRWPRWKKKKIGEQHMLRTHIVNLGEKLHSLGFNNLWILVLKVNKSLRKNNCSSAEPQWMKARWLCAHQLGDRGTGRAIEVYNSSWVSLYYIKGHWLPLFCTIFSKILLLKQIIAILTVQYNKDVCL